MSVQDSQKCKNTKLRVSERNETCFNCRTEAVSHLQNAKTQKSKNAKMQKSAKSIFPIDKRKRTYFAAKNRRRQIRSSGCASPAFSISYGQAKEMATHNGSHLSMYQALSSISGDDKIFRATVECIICHSTTFWNGDAREVGTTKESPFLNIRY